MKESVMQAWVTDLRTPGIVQGRGRLFDGVGYCCLGRLCVVLERTFELSQPHRGHVLDGEGAILPQSVMDQAEMKTPSGATIFWVNSAEPIQVHAELSELNDSGLTFPQIADMIGYLGDLL